MNCLEPDSTNGIQSEKVERNVIAIIKFAIFDIQYCLDGFVIQFENKNN